VDEYDDDGAIILGCWKTKAPVTFITMNIASMARRRWLVIVRIGRIASNDDVPRLDKANSTFYVTPPRGGLEFPVHHPTEEPISADGEIL
jgi:hypothetical protein